MRPCAASKLDELGAEPGVAPPCVPAAAAAPGAPAAVEPCAAPVVGPAGFCFCTAVLGSTGVPLAGPVVLPGCPDPVPCWAIAAEPRASSETTAAAPMK